MCMYLDSSLSHHVFIASKGQSVYPVIHFEAHIIKKLAVTALGKREHGLVWGSS